MFSNSCRSRLAKASYGLYDKTEPNCKSSPGEDDPLQFLLMGIVGSDIGAATLLPLYHSSFMVTCRANHNVITPGSYTCCLSRLQRHQCLWEVCDSICINKAHEYRVSIFTSRKLSGHSSKTFPATWTAMPRDMLKLRKEIT